MKNTLNTALIEVQDGESTLLVKGLIVKRCEGHVIAQYQSDGIVFQVKAVLVVAGEHHPEADYRGEKPTRVTAGAPRRDGIKETWILKETLTA